MSMSETQMSLQDFCKSRHIRYQSIENGAIVSVGSRALNIRFQHNTADGVEAEEWTITNYTESWSRRFTTLKDACDELDLYFNTADAHERHNLLQSENTQEIPFEFTLEYKILKHVGFVFEPPNWLKGEAAQEAMFSLIEDLAMDAEESTDESSISRTHVLKKLKFLKESKKLSSREAIEAWQAAIHSQDTRKSQGAFYTSPDDARSLALDIASVLTSAPRRILEPTCGGGSLVVAILEVFPEHFRLPIQEVAGRIVAMDLDPVGVALARWAVEERFGDIVANAIEFRVGDSLREELDTEIDCVIANPPFGNAIEKKTGRNAAELRDLKRRFPLTTRGAFDRCSLFMERIHQVVPAHAVLGWILPTSFLAHPSASHLRVELGNQRRLVSIRGLSSSAFIGATVGTSVLVIGPKSTTNSGTISLNGTTKSVSLEHLTNGEWSALIHPLTGAFNEISKLMCPLGDHVTVNAGSTTEEAYHWKVAISERADIPSESEEAWLPFIIAGMIEPFHLLWGKETTRYLGEQFKEPMIRLSMLNDRRQAMAQTPRVLVAGLSRAIEAWLDTQGASVGAVSTLSVIPNSPFPLPVLCAILNSAWLRVEYASAFGALALSGGNIQVTRQKLASVPTPKAWWTIPATLAGCRHESVESILASVDLQLGKALPSVEAINHILHVSRLINDSTILTERLWEHLLWLCEYDSMESNYRGWIDILLVSIARRSES